jgi:hypothetical protein
MENLKYNIYYIIFYYEIEYLITVSKAFSDKIFIFRFEPHPYLLA